MENITENEIINELIDMSEYNDAFFLNLAPYKSNGKFSYDDYLLWQSNLTKEKIKLFYNSNEQIEKNLIKMEKRLKRLIKYMKENISNLKYGLCMGSRQGTEQLFFSSQLKIPVLGFDICEDTKKFPNTLIWDFHKLNPNFIDKVSFVFTNSIDQSCNPLLAINTWMKYINVGGLLIVYFNEIIRDDSYITDNISKNSSCVYGNTYNKLKEIEKKYINNPEECKYPVIENKKIKQGTDPLNVDLKKFSITIENFLKKFNGSWIRIKNHGVYLRDTLKNDDFKQFEIDRLLIIKRLK